MGTVRLDGVSKKYGRVYVVDNVTLEIGDGEFVTILGASGSGKTTCLRMVAGFVTPNSGRVLIGDRDVTRDPPYRRNTGMVFQQYALFPHLTVWQNVAYGLKIRRLSPSDIAARSEEALRLVQLDKFSDRYPRQLSGGQKQRVALARAVVIRPEILLLDEPLAALDLKLREELQIEIRRLQKRFGITTLFVTHDQGEALSMSDRVVIMRDGKVLQVATPTELYQRPTSRYVANFVGRTNFLDAIVRGRDSNGQRYVVELCGSPSVIEIVGRNSGADFAEGERCVVAFRPEDAQLNGQHQNCVVAVVESAVYAGHRWLVECTGPGSQPIALTILPNDPVPATASTVRINWSAERSLLLKRD